MTYKLAVLADKPVAYWRLGEASGTTVADSSGKGITGTIAGGVTLKQAGALTGDADTAAAFNGSTGNVVVPDNAALHTADTFTLEAWVKRLSTSSTRADTILSKGTGSYWFGFDGDRLALYKHSGGLIASANVLSTDTSSYHHYVATKSGATVHLYIDGVDRTGTLGSGTIASNNQKLYLGQNASNREWLNATLDEVAVYPTALTPTRIQAHYGLGAPVSSVAVNPPATQPANTGLPVVSGSAQQGQSLATTNGSWTGTAPISYAYQWQRSATGTGSWTAIGGATAANYTLVAGDVGQYVRASVAASNAAGSTSVSSVATGMVAAPPPPPPAPTVDLNASPAGVSSGGSATLTWSSTNATSCTATGAWSGSKATSGSGSTGALRQNASYTLTCTGAGGTAWDSLTVTVTSTNGQLFQYGNFADGTTGDEINDTSWNWFSPHVTLNGGGGTGPNGGNYARLVADDSLVFPNEDGGSHVRIHSIGVKGGTPSWFNNGHEIWRAISLRVPAGFSNGYMPVTDEIHGDNGTPPAMLNLNFTRGGYWRIYIRGGDASLASQHACGQWIFGPDDGSGEYSGKDYYHHQDWLGGNKPVVTGEWINFRMGFYLSDSGDGWFEAWARWGNMTTWLNIVPRKTGIYTSYPDTNGDGKAVYPIMSLYYDTGGGGQNAVDYAAGGWSNDYNTLVNWQNARLGY
jgi:hypothetical protein